MGRAWMERIVDPSALLAMLMLAAVAALTVWALVEIARVAWRPPPSGGEEDDDPRGW